MRQIENFVLEYDTLGEIFGVSNDRWLPISITVMTILLCISIFISFLYFVILLKVDPQLWLMTFQLKCFLAASLIVLSSSFVLSFLLVPLARLTILIFSLLASAGLLFYIFSIHRDIY